MSNLSIFLIIVLNIHVIKTSSITDPEIESLLYIAKILPPEDTEPKNNITKLINEYSSGLKAHYFSDHKSVDDYQNDYSEKCFLSNSGNLTQANTFRITTHRRLFVHNATIELNGNEHLLTVKNKEEARKEFIRAAEAGISAGFVTIVSGNITDGHMVVQPYTNVSLTINFSVYKNENDIPYSSIIHFGRLRSIN